MDSRNGAERFQVLAPAAYLVCVLLVVLPLLDVLIGLDAFTPGVVRWRYGAVGLVTGELLLPLVGAFLAVATAHLAAQPRVQRGLGVLAGMATLVLGAVLLIFVLDTVQLRGGIRPDVLPVYDRVSLKAAGVQVASIATLLLLTLTSLRSVRVLRPGAAARRSAPSHTIVASQASR